MVIGEGWGRDGHWTLEIKRTPLDHTVKIIQIYIMTSEHEFYPHVEDRMRIKDTDKLGIRPTSSYSPHTSIRPSCFVIS